MPERDPSPVVRARALATVLLARPDLAAATEFFRDFGLEPLESASDFASLRGYRSELPCVELCRGTPRYLGLRFEVEGGAELARLAAETGARVEPNRAALGGSRVRLRDPDGIEVEVVAETTRLAPLAAATRASANRPAAVPRVNATVRCPPGSRPTVAKLGHTVLGAHRIATTARWYQRHLGLVVSDFQMLADDPDPVVAFLRCDLGTEPTDHHTLALGSAVDVGHLHTAFELEDAEEVLAANSHLAERGRKHSWGIGRHVLGSQVFDYWRDPYGDLFEHYADGDRFDASVPAGYHAFSGESLHQWGPAPTADMVGRVPTLARARTLLGRLASSDDLSPARLARLFSAAH